MKISPLISTSSPPPFASMASPWLSTSTTIPSSSPVSQRPSRNSAAPCTFTKSLCATRPLRKPKARSSALTTSGKNVSLRFSRRSRSPPSRRPTLCSKNSAITTTPRKSTANCARPRKPLGTWLSRKTAPLCGQLQTVPGGPISGVCAPKPKSIPNNVSPSARNASALSVLAAPQ